MESHKDLRVSSQQPKTWRIANTLCSQWNTAFGPTATVNANPNPMPQPSPPLYTPSSMVSHDLSTYHDPPQQQQYTVPSSMAPVPQVQSVTQLPSYNSTIPTAPNFVTSTMWRDTVASTFDAAGSKRRWDMDSSYLVDGAQSNKRPR